MKENPAHSAFFKIIFCLFFSMFLLAVPDPAISGPVSDTGQSKCYDASGTEIACSGTGQDGEFLINNPSFTELDAAGQPTTGDGVQIKDNVTGLIWEKKTDDGGVHDKDNTYLFFSDPDDPDAEEFIIYLNDQTFGGATNWRLPTLHELINLFNAEETGPATFSEFDNTAFSATDPLIGYWSSTGLSGETFFRWLVNFNDGALFNLDGRINPRYVRAVRDAEE